MTGIEVHQFVPSLAERDAIGQHTVALRDVLRSIGVQSEIYADEIKAGTEGIARHFSTFHSRPSSNRWLIYQGSTLSPMASFLAERPEPKILNYHNVTPPQLISAWEFGAGIATSIALDQIGKFSHSAVGSIAVSNFNAKDLVSLGYRKPLVAPPFIPQEFITKRADANKTLGAKWLFVGRIFPNKAQHDLIAALAAYRRIFDPQATLVLVGNRSSEKYAAALEAYATKLGLSSAVSLTGSVSDADLGDLYHRSDLFVCASDHEGFCFPLIEAMRNGLPIVAYGSTAIPETLGRAGYLVKDKSPVNFAAAAWLTLSDAGLRSSFNNELQTQLQRYSFEETKRQNLLALSEFIPLKAKVN